MSVSLVCDVMGAEGGPRSVVIHIDMAYAAKLLTYRTHYAALAISMPSLRGLELYDDDALYFSAGLEHEYEGFFFVVKNPEALIDKNDDAATYGRMTVAHSGVEFTADYKYWESGRFGSWDIPWALLEEIATTGTAKLPELYFDSDDDRFIPELE